MALSKNEKDMANSFGTLFTITTWGESHGKAIGVVIDGCPAGLAISEHDINEDLAQRAPGTRPFTSSRQERDTAEILSGVFQGLTTGTPISIIIPNTDARPESYEKNKDLIRPGHAQYTYLKKFGIFDYRGGGRASARETACRVAAGAVARKFLRHLGIHVTAFIRQIGEIEAFHFDQPIKGNPLFCPDAEAMRAMERLLEKIQTDKDSIGGIVECTAEGIPAGIGNPIYEKLESSLGKAMLSIPASKGFEIGSGFHAARMRGSEHNDLFEDTFQSNMAGGTLGGISTGMPLVIRVAFKPTPTIAQEQPTQTLTGEKAVISFPSPSRHDQCIAIRAVPVVEAMVCLVLADAMLLSRGARL